MRVSQRVAVSLAVLLVTSAVFAEDITGKWTGTMQEGGNPAAFTLKSDNGGITGTMLGIDGKEHPIADGKLDGDKISFSVATEWQGNPIKLVVKGTVTGEQMQVNIATDDGNWSSDATLKRVGKK